MAIIKLQGQKEKECGYYYEFDTSSKPLGEGGQGKVYQGKRIDSKTMATRDVAIKFLFSGLPESVINRARREANIIIVHENLVEMMGFLEVIYEQPNGGKQTRYHVVSELLIGVSLSDLMQGVVKDQFGNNIPFAENLYALYNTNPSKFAVIITKHILSAIMALHDKGYIHRDIDPSNIMITADGKVKLIDFGIAKLIDGLVTNDKNLTTTGQFMGKPQYAAPELVLGDIKSQNKCTDIYEIGVMMYQLIVGHLPFEGSSNDVLNAHLRSRMPVHNIKDKYLRKIVTKATEKSPANRFRSASEFRVALDGWVEDKKNYDFNLKYILAGVGAIVPIIILSIVLSKCGHNPPPPPPPINDDIHTEESSFTLRDITEDLQDSEKAAKAFNMLKDSVEAGSIPAKFILSRIYSKSHRCLQLERSESIIKKNLIGIVEENQDESEKLIDEIIENDPEFYMALYVKAACLYDAKELHFTERKSKEAEGFLKKADELAKQVGDDMGWYDKMEELRNRYY